MSNSNTNLQTQSSNALHNAIMEAGSKDRPPMLAPGQCPVLTSTTTRNGKGVVTRVYPSTKPSYSKQSISSNQNPTSQPATTEKQLLHLLLLPTYDQEPATVTEDDEMSKGKGMTNSCGFNFTHTFTEDLQTYQTTNPSNFIIKTPVGTNQDKSPELNKGTGIWPYSRECQKPKRVKDAAYHKEKMLLCKQEEAGVQLNAEQADWKDDTDDESNNRIGSTL
ncbi:hypothetical protein Tco_1165058 [Tanacetum coccineum]|uniref:Uncharacterized protein n=1 Tax=Tanacetum coccineum TaxID=301880 RepID=A0ABQ5A267_9ASTR